MRLGILRLVPDSVIGGDELFADLAAVAEDQRSLAPQKGIPAPMDSGWKLTQQGPYWGIYENPALQYINCTTLVPIYTKVGWNTDSGVPLARRQESVKACERQWWRWGGFTQNRSIGSSFRSKGGLTPLTHAVCRSNWE
jgi:hypothetical protein